MPVRLNLSRRRLTLGAGGRLGGNAMQVCGSRLGVGMVCLVRIGNAHIHKHLDYRLVSSREFRYIGAGDGRGSHEQVV